MRGPWKLDMFRKPIIIGAPKGAHREKTLNLGTDPNILVYKIDLLKKVVAMRIGDHTSIRSAKERERRQLSLW